MDYTTIQNLAYSLVAFLVVTVLYQLMKLQAKKTQQHKSLSISRYYSIKRFLFLVSVLVFLVGIFMIWGINIERAWIALTGIVAMVAVAFLAIWSLIGNILAGIILFFTAPFKIDDVIEIAPDQIKGKVVAINSFFVLVIDDEQNHISIPNTLFFQKYIKRYKHQ